MGVVGVVDNMSGVSATVSHKFRRNQAGARDSAVDRAPEGAGVGPLFRWWNATVGE